MGLFDKPLTTQRKLPSEHPMELRSMETADLKHLVEMERLSYQPFVKGEDGKFETDKDGKLTGRTAPAIDEEMEVEITPMFLNGMKGFKKILGNVSGDHRVNIISRDKTPIAFAFYGIDKVLDAIDVGIMLVQPGLPTETKAVALLKLINWFESIAKNSFSPMTVTYDCPDCLDTPMQYIFKFFAANHWERKLVKNAYIGNVDAWRFKHTYPAGKRRKNEKNAA